MGPKVSLSSLQEEKLKLSLDPLMILVENLYIIVLKIININSVKIATMKNILSMVKTKYSLNLFSKTKSLEQKRGKGSRTLPELIQLILEHNKKQAYEQTFWDHLIFNLSDFLLARKVEGQKFSDEEFKLLDKCYYHLRNSYMPQKGTSNQILNIQLLYKQMKQVFDSFRFKINENKMSILSENLPRFARYSGHQPYYVALLYYMGEISTNLRSETKMQIFYYMIRYNIFLSNQRNEKNKETILYEKDFLNWIDVTCIILSSTQVRSIKTGESYQTAKLLIHNIIVIRYHAKYLMKLYPKFLQKVQSSQYTLNQSEKNQIIEMLMRIRELSLYYNRVDKPKLVLNTLKNTIFISDLFINLISKELVHIKTEKLDQRPIFRLYQYIFSMFMASHNMKIWVIIDQPNSHFPFSSSNICSHLQLSDSNLFQFKLWKLAALIVQNLANQRVHLFDKNQLLDLIMFRLIEAIKSPERCSLTRGYQRPISAILTFMPLEVLRKHLYNGFSKNIYQCLSNAEKDEKSMQEIIKLYKAKNSLIMANDNWIHLFNQFIQKDKQIFFWKLYFFLASSQLQEFIKIIPFQRMISLSSEKMTALKSYEEKHSELDEQYLKMCFFLLRLHALYILSGISQAQFSHLLISNSKSEILTLPELNKLFGVWVNPRFKYLEKYSSDSKIIQEKEKGSFIDKVEARRLSIQFTNYFNQIFLKTQCLKQLKLIQIIVSRKEVQSFLASCPPTESNTLGKYIILIFYGMGNNAGASRYSKNYSHILDKVLIQLQKTNIIYNHSYHLLLNQVSHPQQLKQIKNFIIYNQFYYTQIITYALQHLLREEKCSFGQKERLIGKNQIREFIFALGQGVLQGVRNWDKGKNNAINKMFFYMNLVHYVNLRYSIPNYFLNKQTMESLKEWIIKEFAMQFIKTFNFNWIIFRLYFFGLLDSQFSTQLYQILRQYPDKYQLFYVLALTEIMDTNQQAKKQLQLFTKNNSFTVLLNKNRYWIFPFIRIFDIETFDEYRFKMRNIKDQFQVNIMLKELQSRMPDQKLEDIRARIYASVENQSESSSNQFGDISFSYDPNYQNQKSMSQNIEKSKPFKGRQHIENPFEAIEDNQIATEGIFNKVSSQSANFTSNKKVTSKETIKSRHPSSKYVGIFKNKSLI